MADRVLHGKVLLFFARYLAVDIFGLSVMIVVVIARGRRSSEVIPRGRKRSAGSEVSRRATQVCCRSDLGDINIPLLEFAIKSSVTSSRARAGPLRVFAGIFCAVVRCSGRRLPITQRA